MNTQRSFKEIGKFIRFKRLNHAEKYSQSQLSKKLGYKNGQFISNVERGLCGIPLKGIKSLVQILEIDPSELKQVMIRDYEKTLDNFLEEGANSELQHQLLKKESFHNSSNDQLSL